MADNSIANNRSTLKEFLGSLSTIRGDLSNITAPPFVLDTKSTVELPQYWAEHLESFTAPSQASDPGERMLRVLKWWISSLRGQQYAGRDPASGVKKPLNAVLGEVFVGCWDSDGQSSAPSIGLSSNNGIGKTYLVSEQVSHHPPVTACRVWNDTVGVEAEGFTRQEITFSMSSGSVNISQMGYALFKLRNVDQEGEVYLIPLPDVKVKGVLTGTPYPELGGKYSIPSTSGWGAEVEFSGKGFLGIGGGDSGKHGFDAKVFREGAPEKAVWTIAGNWDGDFEIKDAAGNMVEKVDIPSMKSAELKLVDESEMDPYETRQVWKGVREALNRGDMQATSDAKHVVEQGQRDMRKQEEQEGKTWERLFFKDAGRDDIAAALRAKLGAALDREQTVGIWKFDEKAWTQQRPWRGGLRPDNATQQQTRDRSSQANGVAAGAATPAVTHEERNNASRNRAPGSWPQDVANGDAHGPTNSTKALPPLPAEQQQQEVDEAKLADGVGNMSLKEQSLVEDFLRRKYSTSSRRK